MPEYPMSLAIFAKRIAGRNVEQVRVDIRAGKIQCHRLGERGKIFFTEDDVKAFLDSTLVNSASTR